MNLYLLRTWIRARLAVIDERGANLVEYMLLLAFIAIIVLVAVQTLGTTVSSKFSSTASGIG